MSSSISAGLTTGTAIAISGDTSGSLVLQTNGTTTAVTLDTSQNATFAGKVTSAGALTLASNGTTTAVTIDTSQNVGIGTSTNAVYDGVAQPRPLVVQSSSTTTTQYDSTNAIVICNSNTTTNNASQLNFAAITGASTNQYTSAVISCIYGARTNTIYPSGILTFATSTAASAPTERMRIDSSGNVGIGITGMADRLAVYYTRASQQGITIKPSADTGGGNAMLFMNAAGTLVGYIATTASATTYATSSDYRLKDNIVPMVGALNTVAALKPVTYKWKVDGSNGQGFIAHELQSIVPDCVTGEKDAVDEEGKPVYQGIDTSFLVATLTAAIQELNAKFEEYKAAHP